MKRVMPKSVTATLALVVAGMACQGSALGAVLYNQTDSAGAANADPSTANFAPSDDFPGASYSLVADDFAVPAGKTWQIRGVYAAGAYGGSPPPAVNVGIFADASGAPGSKLFEQDGVSASGGPNYQIPVLVPDIAAGRYWVAVQQAGAEFGGAALWSWTTRTVQSGFQAHYADSDPVGGCSPGTWYPRLSCWSGSNPDQVFSLQGTAIGGGQGAKSPSSNSAAHKKCKKKKHRAKKKCKHKK